MLTNISEILEYLKEQLNPTIQTNEEVAEKAMLSAIPLVSMGNPNLFFGKIDTQEDLGELKELEEVEL